MADTYLIAAFKDKEKVKALGARWDPEQRKWFVPYGRELTPFDEWLPAEARAGEEVTGVAPMAVAGSHPSADLAVPSKGMTLSQLLGGVTQAVAQAYRAGIWTLVWLQGAMGDALHALSCAAGHNILRLMRAIARLGLDELFVPSSRWSCGGWARCTR